MSETRPYYTPPASVFAAQRTYELADVIELLARATRAFDEADALSLLGRAETRLSDTLALIATAKAELSEPDTFKQLGDVASLALSDGLASAPAVRRLVPRFPGAA